MINQYLIIGQGDIGLPLAVRLSKLGHQVTGLARSPKQYDENISFWQKDALTLGQEELMDFTHIAIIITPRHDSDRVRAYRESYLAVCEHLAGLAEQLPNVQQILFVSSTSVYGENDGEVIDHNTTVRPASDTAHVLYQAELTLRGAFGDKCVIVRPSGIYGKQRLRLVRLAKTAHQDGASDTALTNRIMDTDLVNVLANIVQMTNFEPVYVVTDDCPASAFEVLCFICQNLGCPPPKRLSLPPSGKKILANIPSSWLTFGDYRQGYGEILRDCQKNAQ